MLGTGMGCCTEAPCACNWAIWDSGTGSISLQGGFGLSYAWRHYPIQCLFIPVGQLTFVTGGGLTECLLEYVGTDGNGYHVWTRWNQTDEYSVTLRFAGSLTNWAAESGFTPPGGSQYRPIVDLVVRDDNTSTVLGRWIGCTAPEGQAGAANPGTAIRWAGGSVDLSTPGLHPWNSAPKLNHALCYSLAEVGNPLTLEAVAGYTFSCAGDVDCEECDNLAYTFSLNDEQLQSPTVSSTGIRPHGTGSGFLPIAAAIQFDSGNALNKVLIDYAAVQITTGALDPNIFTVSRRYGTSPTLGPTLRLAASGIVSSRDARDPIASATPTDAWQNTNDVICGAFTPTFDSFTLTEV